MKPEIVVISVGGSLIVPDDINTKFLKDLKSYINANIHKRRRFILITGGGRTCRRYQEAAEAITHNISDESLDYIGIQATHLNGELVLSVFKDHAYPRVIHDPTQDFSFTQDVLVVAGWIPGVTSDYDAILLAKRFGAKKIINLTDIDYVYDKDPKKYKYAKKIENIRWSEFLRLLGNENRPGMHAPFGRKAAIEAQKLELEVAIIGGMQLGEMEKYLNGEHFVGTRVY